MNPSKERHPRPDEPQIIFPDVQTGARNTVSEHWRIDHARLDQLAHEILTKFRYDQPLAVLSTLTSSPLTITRHLDGVSYAQRVARYDGVECFGNCYSLCSKLLLDPDFRLWLVELEEKTGCRIYPYLTEGNAPEYFVSSCDAHFWLFLRHEHTRSRILVDPSFQRVGSGYDYRSSIGAGQLIDQDSKISRGGSVHLKLAKYDVDVGNKIIFPNPDITAEVLGMTPQGKVLCCGFACGQTAFETVIPLAKLISRLGKREDYYLDLKVGIVEVITKTPPDETDLPALTAFFEIAANFEFRRGQY